MMFVDRHERSLAPKLFVAMALLAGLVLAGWMLFGPLDALPEGCDRRAGSAIPPGV